MAQQVHEGVFEAVGASVANKFTFGGAATGFFGWLAQVNWIGLAGVLIALAGLAANYYFQHRRDVREQAESDARIQAYREQCRIDSRAP
jgi:heme exporter protein D